MAHHDSVILRCMDFTYALIFLFSIVFSTSRNYALVAARGEFLVDLRVAFRVG